MIANRTQGKLIFEKGVVGMIKKGVEGTKKNIDSEDSKIIGGNQK
jgi:hypothetical protein